MSPMIPNIIFWEIKYFFLSNIETCDKSSFTIQLLNMIIENLVFLGNSLALLSNFVLVEQLSCCLFGCKCTAIIRN